MPSSGCLHIRAVLKTDQPSGQFTEMSRPCTPPMVPDQRIGDARSPLSNVLNSPTRKAGQSRIKATVTLHSKPLLSALSRIPGSSNAQAPIGPPSSAPQAPTWNPYTQISIASLTSEASGTQASEGLREFMETVTGHQHQSRTSKQNADDVWWFMLPLETERLPALLPLIPLSQTRPKAPYVACRLCKCVS